MVDLRHKGVEGESRWQTNRVRAICWIDPGTVKEKSDTRQSLSLALAEGIHQLAELSGSLDLEKDFIVVVRL